MNRRRFFSFLAAAPIAVATGAVAASEAVTIGIDGGGLDGALACAKRIAHAGDHIGYKLVYDAESYKFSVVRVPMARATWTINPDIERLLEASPDLHS